MRVDPIPGEALESWLAALATRMNATWGELLDVVLPIGADGIARGHRGAVLTTAVSDAERESISAATGVGGCDIDEMTLAGHYGSPLITIDRRTGRARTPWGPQPWGIRRRIFSSAGAHAPASGRDVHGPQEPRREQNASTRPIRLRERAAVIPRRRIATSVRRIVDVLSAIGAVNWIRAAPDRSRSTAHTRIDVLICAVWMGRLHPH